MVSAPFLPRLKAETIGFNIHTLLGLKVPIAKGDVGIEIEVEGNKFLKDDDLIPLPWSYHKDGSLRGHDNAEYVLKGPIPFATVPKAIEELWRMFAAYGSVLDVSNRTSVHVHLNVQQWHLNRLTAFLALYFSVEELLTEWCGDHRVGNLFCLRAKDATAIVTMMRKFIERNGRFDLRDGLHYAGLNTQALYKFGSVEIRTLRGATDPATIITWIGLLEHIYKLSEQFKDPRDLPGMLSAEGPMNYLEFVLGEYTNMIKDGIGWPIHRIRESLYEGIRLAQDLCYCRDWSLYKPSDIKADPFGRDMQKLSANLVANTYTAIDPLIEVINTQAVHQFAQQYTTQTQFVQAAQAWAAPVMPAYEAAEDDDDEDGEWEPPMDDDDVTVEDTDF